MEIYTNWHIGWASFFDEHTDEFSLSFKYELAKQLFEKGSTETGIRGFDKHYFQILVGIENLEMRQVDNHIFALISFIVPPALSIPVWIYWTSKELDITNLHTQEVSNISVEFHWGSQFPKGEILENLKPFKKERKEKSGLIFDVEYYYNGFPDISFEIYFQTAPKRLQIESIRKFFIEFVEQWNRENKDKSIYYLGELTLKEGKAWEIIFDFGAENSNKIIKILLKELSRTLNSNEIEMIRVH